MRQDDDVCCMSQSSALMEGNDVYNDVCNDESESLDHDEVFKQLNQIDKLVIIEVVYGFLCFYGFRGGSVGGNHRISGKRG